jgi:glycerophosphoryl diester phosphodiesterase
MNIRSLQFAIIAVLLMASLVYFNKTVSTGFYQAIGMITKASFIGLMRKKSDNRNFDIQGHRGCRGLFPENTIAGFLQAVQIGVNTLEMDVVVNAENQVVVSHDPFYHTDITTLSNGRFLSLTSQFDWNIYKMTSAEMSGLDVGLKTHPRFTKQKKMAASKPLLSDVFQTFKNEEILFNVEIKRKPEGDGVFHPDVRSFVDLVVGVIQKYNMADRVTVQSFDVETLQFLHSAYPAIKTAFLTDDRLATFDDNIEKLGFVPSVYSPQYRLVTPLLVNYCHKNGVRIIPWTVNHASTMRKLIYWGVDGIITDYPDKLVDLMQTKQL